MTTLSEKSRDLRRSIVRTLAAGQRGHVGSAFSLVEILRTLYDDILKYDPADPRAADRDRCILSKGHGCLALYGILSEKGFFSKSELEDFCKSEGMLGGHPEYGKVPGVEASTGSLGHGLSIGLGMAIAAKNDGAKHRVFVVMGDGELNEGSVWEAAMCAAKHRLTNLIGIVDYNKQQSYSTTREVLDLEPLADKWRSFGWGVTEVDGHDTTALRETLMRLPFVDEKPSMLICHTIKGKGTPLTEGNLAWHHKNKVSDEEIEELLGALK